MHHYTAIRVSEYFLFTSQSVPVIIQRAHSGPYPIKIGEIHNMSVDAKAEIVIERPRSEVAKIMFDPKVRQALDRGTYQRLPTCPAVC